MSLFVLRTLVSGTVLAAEATVIKYCKLVAAHGRNTLPSLTILKAKSLRLRGGQGCAFSETSRE